jgi:hypothetical protein
MTNDRLSGHIALEGPISFQNFLAARRGMEVLVVAEVPLYSDAYFTGEVRGQQLPFELLNPIRSFGRQVAQSLVLRMQVRAPFPEHPAYPFRQDISRFTGTDLYDELACLLSLQLGARLAAGGETRRFDGGDPLGTPRSDIEAPRAIAWASVHERSVIPAASRSREVHAGLLSSLGDLEPRHALTLIRAARQYRDALWVADENPQLAWLLLVSAVEAVAQESARQSTRPEQVVSDFDSELQDILRTLDPEVASSIYQRLATLVGATSKFKALFDRFPPEPPAARPPEGFRFEPWADRVKSAVAKVYKLRSRALHAGEPFPYPMCVPPPAAGGEAPCETVPGLGMSAQGGQWNNADTPINLHLFEHLARSAMLSWWASLVPGPSAQ